MSSLIVAKFTLGGAEVPLQATYSLSQQYSPIGGYATLRTLGGVGIKQTNWTRIRTSVSGSGTIPPGLIGLDYSASLLMQCIGPRQVTSISNIMTIPTGRRSDVPFEPMGFGRVGGQTGGWVQTTTLSLIGDTISLDPVGGADLYRVEYYPELTVFAQEPNETPQPHSREFGWTLNAEEV